MPWSFSVKVTGSSILQSVLNHRMKMVVVVVVVLLPMMLMMVEVFSLRETVNQYFVIYLLMN